MPTRFYLHDTTSGLPTGTLPSAEQSSLAADDTFEGSDSTNRLMDTSIGSSQASLANTSVSSASEQIYYVSRWVSPAIYNSSISANTWTYNFAAQQDNNQANFPCDGNNNPVHVNCYVWKPSDGTKYGTILDGNTASTVDEASGGSATSEVSHHVEFTGSAVSSLTSGDAVIVFEAWFRVTQAMTGTHTQTFYYDGTTENTTDNSDVSDHASFLETPQPILFSGPVSASVTVMHCASSGSSAGSTSTADTTEYINHIGLMQFASTEATVQIPYEIAGTLSNLFVGVGSNSVNDATDITIRINGSSGNQTISMPASTSGNFEDPTNTDSISASDLVNLISEPGAGSTGTYIVNRASVLFDETSIFAATFQTSNFNLDAATRYNALSGTLQNNNTVEARVQSSQKVTGTFSDLGIYVTTNARGDATTLSSRLNGANGNLSVSVGTSTTGLVQDTTDFDNVVATDLYNTVIVTGSGTNDFIVTFVTIMFTSSSGQVRADRGPQEAVSANNTIYNAFGASDSQGLEDDAQISTRAAFTFSNMDIYVQDNTLSDAATITFRVNGSNGNQSISVAATDTGHFTDSSSTDTTDDDDLVNYQIIAGTAGTSITYNQLAVFSVEAAAGGAEDPRRNSVNTIPMIYWPPYNQDLLGGEVVKPNVRTFSKLPHQHDTGHLNRLFSALMYGLPL